MNSPAMIWLLDHDWQVGLFLISLQVIIMATIVALLLP
jgi:hypothetical protein